MNTLADTDPMPFGKKKGEPMQDGKPVRCYIETKTKCHCGKPLNEDGLCWCCDPISNCWPQ